MTQQYNDPLGGVQSSIGAQVRTDFYDRKALYETRRERYFSSMADVTSMPKNYGKKIKKYHMMPLLDDRNINDQGINAAGVAGAVTKTLIIKYPNPDSTVLAQHYITGEGANDGAATTAAEAAGQEFATNVLGYGEANWAASVIAIEADGGVVDQTTPSVSAAGNLYGSSKDVGVIKGKLPTIGENGGRVNRVGFSRVELEGTMENYGIFTEFSEDLFNFDSMSDLYENISRELITGAVQMTEGMIQIDLLEAAGVIRFPDGVMSDDELSGETGSVTEITYADLQRLSITLDDNRCPKSVKMIKGSTMIDTVTVDNGRFLYVGSELIPSITKMTDHFGNPAFVSVEQYGYAGTYKEGTNMIHGEIGKVGQFRIIVVPEMFHWAGVGASVTTNDGYRETDGQYDVFPMLCIGSESFTTIGFQTGGGSNFKFKIITRMPGEIVTLDDPYAKTGFSSLQFWYGFMPLRSERIALAKTVAEI